jgi:hypothetical protein
MPARPCPGSIGGSGASEDRYTVALPDGEDLHQAGDGAVTGS